MYSECRGVVFGCNNKGLILPAQFASLSIIYKNIADSSKLPSQEVSKLVILELHFDLVFRFGAAQTNEPKATHTHTHTRKKGEFLPRIVSLDQILLLARGEPTKFHHLHRPTSRVNVLFFPLFPVWVLTLSRISTEISDFEALQQSQLLAQREDKATTYSLAC